MFSKTKRLKTIIKKIIEKNIINNGLKDGTTIDFKHFAGLF